MSYAILPTLMFLAGLAVGLMLRGGQSAATPAGSRRGSGPCPYCGGH